MVGMEGFQTSSTSSSLSSSSLSSTLALDGTKRAFLSQTYVPESNRILKGGRNFYVGLKRVGVWQALVLLYDTNGEKDYQILIRLASVELVAVGFTL